MQRYSRSLIFSALILFLFIGNFSTQAPSPKLSSAIRELVPQGCKLESCQTFVFGTTGKVEFTASMPIAGRRDVRSRDYNLELTLMEKPPELVAMQAPAYRRQLELDSQSAFNSRNEIEPSILDASIGRDKPQWSKYPWGNGITQRVIHKYVGAGKGADEIEYSCIYFGLIISGNVVKTFKLSVSGVDDRGEADQWAQKVADGIARTSLGGLKVE